MFPNTTFDFMRSLDELIKLICRSAYKNAPTISMVVSIATLAVKHFYEDETSSITVSDGLSTALVPFAAIGHLYHLREKVKAQIPTETVDGTHHLQAPVIRLATEENIVDSLESKSELANKVFWCSAMVEMLLISMMILLDMESQHQSRYTRLLQFFIESFFVLIETGAYHYGVKTLQRLKVECRELRGGLFANPAPNPAHESDSDDDSDDDRSDHSEDHDESLNSSHGSLASSIASFFNDNLVRAFSISASSDDYSIQSRDTPDSCSVPDDQEINKMQSSKYVAKSLIKDPSAASSPNSVEAISFSGAPGHLG